MKIKKKIEKTVEIKKTARLIQLAGIFDLNIGSVSRNEWKIDIELPEKWGIGLIYGPSGAGKTTVANEMFKGKLVKNFKWEKNKSVIDCFENERSIEEITKTLSSVGFSSPPAWLRPYFCLSNGEQFRVTMARAILESKGLFVMDEFTSIVDRVVAKIGSIAIQKEVRRREKQFVAVSCHADIIDWLDPDWIYEPNTNKLTRRSLRRRPKVKLEIRRVYRTAWEIFKKHHYLATTIAHGATCFVGYVDNRPAVFGAYVVMPRTDRIPAIRSHRVVTLPDYQGIGLGNVMSEFMGALCTGQKKIFTAVTSHPAMVRFRARSTHWIMKRKPKPFSMKMDSARGTDRYDLHLRAPAGFKYVGPKMNKAESDKLLLKIKLSK